MARANFVQKAAKDYPEHGIKKGEPYYWWKFRHGGKRYSKTQPKASQLTQSPFKSQYYGIQESLDEISVDSLDDLESALNDIAGELNSLAEECRSSKENMPEGLQEGDTGQMLEERADGCESWASEIESIDYSPESVSFDGDKFRCDDGECEWTGEEMPEGEHCPTCGKDVVHTTEYDEAIQERIEEIIEEVRNNDPGCA